MHGRGFVEERAEVGVGTLIVFIAMVLVAAVAASVLIGTTGTLQQRGQATAKEATQEVSANFGVLSIHGARANASDATVSDVRLTLALSAGAVPTDVTPLIVRWSDGTNVRTFAFSAAPLPDAQGPVATYNLTWVRGAGGGSFVMSSGDLVELHVNGVALAPRAAIELTLVPERGSVVQADFRAPAVYVGSLDVDLKG